MEDQTNPAQEHYGATRLDRFLPAVAKLPPDEMLKAIEADLDRFSEGSPMHDDQTMIVMKVR